MPTQNRKNRREVYLAVRRNSYRKVIAFICGLIVIILMIMGLVSTDWLMADGWRQGLFMHCIADDAEQPLPFNLLDPPGCYPSRSQDYIRAAAALCIVALIADLVATVLTGLGLRTKDHHTKHKCYRCAVIIMGVALLSILIALIIYPVCFAAELNLEIAKCGSLVGHMALDGEQQYSYLAELYYYCATKKAKKFIIRNGRSFLITIPVPRGHKVCPTLFSDLNCTLRNVSE